MTGRIAAGLLLAGAFALAAPAGAQEADLSTIYPVGWTEWERDFEGLVEAIDRYLALKTEPLVGPEALLEALRRWEEVQTRATKVEGYVQLLLDLGHRNDEARDRQARLDDVNERWYREAAVWFEPLLLEIGEEEVGAWVDRTEGLQRYRFHLRRIFRGASHSLPEGEERLLALSDVFARQTRRAHAALGRAADLELKIELDSGDRFVVNPTSARTMLFELDHPADRRRTQKAWLERLGIDSDTNGVLLESVVQNRRFVADARNFEGPLAAALHNDAIPPAAVEGLIETARARVEPLRSYHRLRRRILGLGRYGAADRFVPLAAARDGIDFEEARRLILASATPLGAEIEELLRQAFSDGWIDAVDRPGKASKSKLSPVLGPHPYVVVTYDGTTRSFLNLAHELGHAVHRVLADQAQSWVNSRYSTLTAETVASVHELALVEHLLASAESPEDRVAALDYAIQSLLRTFYRTVIDADFELGRYEPTATFSAEALAEAYRQGLSRYYGDSLTLESWDGNGWLETPHFFTAPLYLPRYGLAYAAGVALIEGLTTGDAATREAARLRYLTLLRAGGSDFPAVLLAQAGADLEATATVASVPRRLERLVRELAAALAECDGCGTLQIGQEPLRSRKPYIEPKCIVNPEVRPACSAASR